MFNREDWIMPHWRYDLTAFEWKTIQLLSQDKPRGVLRGDTRHVLNGVFRHLLSDSPMIDLPELYGPRTTALNHFNRWRKAGA